MSVAGYRTVLALVAVLAATGAFLSYALTRPLDPDQRTVDLARVHHDSVADVRRAFAAQGIRLPHVTDDGVVVWLSVMRAPVPDSSLYVLVGGRTGTMSWGPKPRTGYDETMDNLLVHYGGGDARTLAAVEAAVASLR
jgi:hypothetical protein